MSDEKLELFRKDFTFEFIDEVTSDGFFNSSSIIYTPSDKTDNRRAREVLVKIVSDKCEFVKSGDKVLLEALMWTVGFDVNGEKTWISDEDKILAYIEESD